MQTFITSNIVTYTIGDIMYIFSRHKLINALLILTYESMTILVSS